MMYAMKRRRKNFRSGLPPCSKIAPGWQRSGCQAAPGHSQGVTAFFGQVKLGCKAQHGQHDSLGG